MVDGCLMSVAIHRLSVYNGCKGQLLLNHWEECHQNIHKNDLRVVPIRSYSKILFNTDMATERENF